MRLRLAARPSSIREARRRVVEHARDHGASAGTTRVAELLTSEVVTNAVKYGPQDGTITVEASCRGDRYDVVVSDESHERPVVRHPPATQSGGRGMGLVQALAAEWGVDLHDGDGKSVWIALAT